MSELSTRPFIIVPAEQILYRFRIAMAVVTNADYDVTELVSEACAVLEHGNRADLAERTKVVYDRTLHNSTHRDAELISKAWFEMAMGISEVYDRLRKHLGLGNHARLPYYLAAILPSDDLKLGRYENN